MNTPPDPPAGLIPVPAKGAVLLLTQAEYLTGIRRGKWWRRSQAMERREGMLTTTNPTNAEEVSTPAELLVFSVTLAGKWDHLENRGASAELTQRG